MPPRDCSAHPVPPDFFQSCEDPVVVTDPGFWDGLITERNTADPQGPRRRLNLIEGANITLTHADNPGNDSTDFTIAAAVGPDFHSIINFYNTVNFFETANFYNATNFNYYFTWQPVSYYDPTTNIVFNPGTSLKYRIVTGCDLLIQEYLLGSAGLTPEIQDVWIVNGSAGTFKLTITNVTAGPAETAQTVNIAWNATAATVQTAINNAAATFVNSLPGRALTFVVTGTGTAFSPWRIVFHNDAISLTTSLAYPLLIGDRTGLGSAPFDLVFQGISGGVHGRILILENAGPGKVTLKDMNATALAAVPSSAIDCPLQNDYTIWPDNSVMLEYDAFGVFGEPGVGVWRFMHPTFGASSASDGDLVYACNRLYFSTGLTFTPNGDGTAVVTVDPTPGTPCLVFNQVTGTTAITDGSVTLSTFSLTIPSDGAYKVVVRVSASATNTLGSLTLTATGYLEINGIIIQQGPMFHTSIEPQSAGSITFDLQDGLVAGDVIKAACMIVPGETGRGFDYTISYLKICGQGGS